MLATASVLSISKNKQNRLLSKFHIDIDVNLCHSSNVAEKASHGTTPQDASHFFNQTVARPIPRPAQGRHPNHQISKCPTRTQGDSYIQPK
eukprot:2750794-Amphidinium_carterae.1